MKGRTMSSRKRLLISIMALLGSGGLALAQVDGIEVGGGATAQVYGGKAPVVQVTDPEGALLASIPIGRNPGRYIYSESANTLYVVHNEKQLEHFISAVNLTTQQVDKQIPVRAGESSGPFFLSAGGRRLFFYTAGRRLPAFAIGTECFYDNRFLQPPFDPSITVIDTASNEVIATYNWLGAFREGLQTEHKNWAFGSQFVAASDTGQLIVTALAFWRKPLKEQLAVFSGSSPDPAFFVETGRPVAASMFSKDQQLLFAAVHGDKQTAGSLIVVDLKEGTAVQHELTDDPRGLCRLGSNHEPWIVSGQEIRAVSEAGEPGDRRIQLNKPRKTEEGEESGGSAFLDGLPGETIALGNEHAAMLIKAKDGGSHHKLALLDLKKLEVDAIIPTMSAGEKARIRTGRILLAVALTAATAGNVIFTPNLYLRNESLAARPDGRFLFALDTEGHEVTVVDVPTATVVRRIAVNKTITRLKVSSDGKHLICFGGRTQQIDLESNNLEN